MVLATYKRVAKRERCAPKHSRKIEMEKSILSFYRDENKKYRNGRFS